jgi:hypothetical protein
MRLRQRCRPPTCTCLVNVFSGALTPVSSESLDARYLRSWAALYLEEPRLLERAQQAESASASELQLTASLYGHIVDSALQLGLPPTFEVEYSYPSDPPGHPPTVVRARATSDLLRGLDAHSLLAMPFHTFPDCLLALQVSGMHSPFCPFLGQDKTSAHGLKADRMKLIEQMRFALRSVLLLEKVPSMVLETISIFGLLTAGPHALLLELCWSGVEESIFFVRQVAQFNLRARGDIRSLFRHLWAVAQLARDHLISILHAVNDPKQPRHAYIDRPFRNDAPATDVKNSKSTTTPGGASRPTFSPSAKLVQDGCADLTLHTRLHRSSRSTVYLALRHDEGSVVKVGLQRHVEREVRLLQELGGRCHVVALRRGPMPMPLSLHGYAALELPYLPDVRVASVEQLRSFAGQALEAGAFLHEHGVIYADFKRANMRWDGRDLTVIDLDACIVPAEASDASKLPRHFGTYGYRAPEVEAGSCPAAPAADVWSLAIVFAYEALELVAALGMCQLVLQQNLPRGLACLESHLGPRHPLCDLVRRMLRDAPEERPTFRQLLQHPWLLAGLAAAT